MYPLRLKIQQKIFKLVVNRADRQRRQESFVSNENFLQFVKKIEELESFVEDIFIFEANPQYKFFSVEIEKLLGTLDNLHTSSIKTLNETLLLLPKELLKDTIEGIKK